jgi:hypothetical protein
MQWLNEARRKSMFAAAICAIAMVGISSGTALAGEVTGSGKPTAGPEHANSICAFSGQNDFENGQTIFHVQSPGQEHRLGFTPPGVPGEACKGFSNPDNPREKKGK